VVVLIFKKLKKPAMKKDTYLLKFRPYYVNIRILPALFSDYFKFDADRISDIYKKAASKKEYSLLNYGLTFNLLHIFEDYKLVFNVSEKYFKSTVDFENEIFDFDDDYTVEHFKEPNFKYKFCVKEGFRGYEMGLVTPESSKKTIMVGDDNNYVLVTTIPYSMFPSTRTWNTKTDTLEHRKALEEFGWSIDETLESVKTDWIGLDNTSYNHKYFTMTWSPI